LKRIRTAHGTTINDVVLAAITRAFRDLLDGRGELTERNRRKTSPGVA
jgi:diacylglycerol O-acyltransferase